MFQERCILTTTNWLVLSLPSLDSLVMCRKYIWTTTNSREPFLLYLEAWKTWQSFDWTTINSLEAFHPNWVDASAWSTFMQKEISWQVTFRLIWDAWAIWRTCDYTVTHSTEQSCLLKYALSKTMKHYHSSRSTALPRSPAIAATTALKKRAKVGPSWATYLST